MQAFFDLRAFGGVLSTEGPLKGSFYGQCVARFKSPLPKVWTKVLPLDATITRCAVASSKEQQQAASSEDERTNRTMGRKHGIDYGLYRCHIHFSPAFAAKTGFSYYDFDNFLFALRHMFDDDHAAGRHLRLVGLVDFQHQSALEMLPRTNCSTSLRFVENRGEGRQAGFSIFWQRVSARLGGLRRRGVRRRIHVTKDGNVEVGKNGEGVAVIKAKCIVWEIPSKQSDGKSS